MIAYIKDKLNIFTKEFVTTIMDRETSRDYDWRISFYCEYDEDLGDLCGRTTLVLYDEDEEEVMSIMYDVVRNDRMRYIYVTTFTFGEIAVSNVEKELDEFREIQEEINKYKEGLYDKICAYIHNYTQEQLYYEEDVDNEWPPLYKECYSPSKVKNFMKKYGVSQYVPLVMEVVDEQGIPIKYLDIKNVYFNDEANQLIISMKE